MSDILVMCYPGSRFFRDSALGLVRMLGELDVSASFVELGGGSWAEQARRAALACRPKAAILINMTRMTLGRGLEKVGRVATWRQDDCSELDGAGKRESWMRECHDRGDLVFGYTCYMEREGWPRDRLVATPLFIDPSDMAGLKGEGPVLMMASNKGGDPLALMREAGLAGLPLGILGDRLWRLYMGGGRLESFKALEDFCLEDAGTRVVGDVMRQHAGPRILLYWQFAERIYRRVQAQWMTRATERWALLGDGWPKIKGQEARTPGVLDRRDLATWRASSRWTVHANGVGGWHHNLVEILLSGGRPLCHDASKGPESPWRLFPRDEYVTRQRNALEGLVRRILGPKNNTWPGDPLWGYQDCCRYYRTLNELKEYAKPEVVDGTSQGPQVA